MIVGILGTTHSCVVCSRITSLIGLPSWQKTVEPIRAPEWELENLDGKTVESSHFKGKVIVLNCWMTSCPPCIAEIPEFVQLQKKYESRNVTVLGMLMSHRDFDELKSFMKELGINYPVLICDEEFLGNTWGVQMFPTTFIINRKGNIASVYSGSMTFEELEEEIQPLL